MAKSLNSIYAALVVALSYSLKNLVNMIPESVDVAIYFTSFMLLSLTIMLFCMIGNRLLKGYGVLNFVLMVFYFPLVLVQSDMSYMIIWELPIFSIANIVYAYEIILISLGIYHGWIVIVDWLNSFKFRVGNGLSITERLAK